MLGGQTPEIGLLVQAECEGVPVSPDYQHLHNELWARQTTAIERASSAALAAAAEARDAASRQMPEFVDSVTRVCAPYCTTVGNSQISTAYGADVLSSAIRTCFPGVYSNDCLTVLI